MAELNITSTLVEKSLDAVKGFVEKLAGGAIEEAGLMLADKVKLRRLKNQIKILEKAKKIADEANMDIKQINLKVLVPMLEYSSLEEEESLQDMWANLIANYSNANNKHQSNIYPFILSQLSSEEAVELKSIYSFKETGETRKFKLGLAGINNLVRLGLLEKAIPKIIEQPRFFGIETYNNKEDTPSYKMTALGKEFYECCRR